MVVNKQGEMLYNGVLSLITENLGSLAEQFIYPAYPTAVDGDPVTESQENERLLKALTKVWEDHTSSTQKLSHILKYMDRVHTKAANVPEVIPAGQNLFLKHIIRPPIKDHIISAILGLLRIERDGYVINRSAATGCVDVLLQLSNKNDTLSVYKEDLEPVILKETEGYYRAEGDRLLETCDASECLRRIDSRFSEEQSRAHQYLSVTTAEPIRHILQDTLLTPHLHHIIGMSGSGLDVMIDNEKTDDLSRLYRLFVTVPEGLPCLRRAIKESVIRRGKEFNNDTPMDQMDDVDGGEEQAAPAGKGKGKARATTGAQSLALALKWVEDVLRLKDKFDAVWKDCFKVDREIESGLNESFESFINLQPRAPEFVSLFIDENLKKGLKGKTDIEVESILDKTITVFRYITEKDVFERYYKGHLAKRLLLGRSVSDDAERGMLAKLKVECGFQFTQKLEGMFHDMKISADTMQAYRNHLAKSASPPDVDISVTVMTSTFWPMAYASVPCVLPSELVSTSRAFEQYYLSRHSGRRLTWQPSMGNADVKVTFKSKRHDLNVSTFALVILLLFQNLGEGEFLTYQEIKDSTLIPDTELQRNLQSLACAKFKILKKHPPGRDVNPEDSFSFNNDFTSPLQKIKISTVASKVESGEERKETQDRVEEERRHQTEACIVRIMKDRKHMTHNDLVNEVTRQLAMRFQPNPLNIKKRIEGLIEREYLERCADRKSYNYMVGSPFSPPP
ncbi:Cullin-domain-containing protein [Stereum hirsutum FP-91666 SS1]|uniref:Cullin-domain-containing protein n=1 Tax=Stereum hirsutum (strain FP-91666) TaxID=721885 RepID=UPI0004409F0B|nr:Cullin-domain-containing protein [Stereum hirsutum FP-91666 SS1]EIM90785.1 Cullin-domain-containing protein [Stereum hirsutum FP-91666 SS1]